MKRKTLLIIFFIFPISLAAEGFSEDVKLASSAAGSLILSGRQDNNHYKNIYFVDNEDAIHRLFKNNFLYQKVSDNSISLDKKYYVLNQIESGLVEGDDGESFPHEVASCVFIDVNNGCVVRKETGEFCGGDWTDGHDWTKPGGASASVDRSRPTVDALIADFNASNRKDKKASSYIKYGATVDNLVRCDPIDKENTENYKTLEKSLISEGDAIEAKFLREEINSTHNQDSI